MFKLKTESSAREVMIMLRNNNREIIGKLAKNSMRTNRKQYGILFFTILLSAFMLLSVFTIGISYLASSRLQNTRLNGAEYDIAVMNGFSPRQLEALRQNKQVQSVGIESYAGFIKSTEFDQTVEIGLLWCDEIFWEEQRGPARTQLEGHYPQKKNELMVTKEFLKACGNEKLSVGDSFSLTYENNTGVHTEKFVISGIWDGYGDKSAGFVSEALYEAAGYELGNDGILCIKLNHNYVLPAALESLKEDLALSDRQIFAPTGYIENSFKLLLGICGLALIICLSAYLLIYNILYLSVSGKIRYYGLLQALGMTKKQLAHFIFRQMLLTGILATLAGILLGIFSCMKLVPYTMDILGIAGENIELHCSPLTILLGILVTGIAIFGGIRSPLRFAAKITPVEASRYRGAAPKGKGYKKKKSAFFWRMALAQLKKEKKKTAVVLLSLATSLSVFYCLTTIISTQGERTVAPNYWNSDLIIKNQTQTPEDVNSLRPAIDGSLVGHIEEIPGIQELHLVEGVPVSFPYHPEGFFAMWIDNYVERTTYLSREETLDACREHPENYYGMLKGIDGEEFDYLAESLNTAVDKQDFLAGRACIVLYAGSEIPPEYLKQKVPFILQNRQYEIAVEAVSYEMYYSGRNIGPTLIVSQDYLRGLIAQPSILSMSIQYARAYDEELENQIMQVLDRSPYRDDLYVESQYENKKVIQESQGQMLEIGTAAALLLLLVGTLNYANTIAGSIQNRRLTLSVMESVGMSGRQINRLLIREGICYAAFSLLITLTAGTAVTYICFQAMNYMGVPFKIPAAPLLGAAGLLLLICTVTPILSYRRLVGKRSLAERIRDYE